MCGIAGLMHPDAAARTAAVGIMLDAIRHRGRDDSGIWTAPGCALGHVRLSIIDLGDGGRQPLGNEDSTIQVSFNGEIYNYRELREALLARGHRLRSASDTEVLPHLYEEHGPSFVEHLRGMYAIALWDAKRHRLVLARDRAGKKPLYYAAIPGGITFASEMKALFTVPGVDTTVRDAAIDDYLSFGAVPGEETAYRGIRRVPAASVLCLEPGRTPELLRYWSPAYLPKLALSREEALDGILSRLREAVALRLRSDVRVGCFLSGGIDSGLVTALAAEASSTPLRTYSIGFADAAFDERGPAAEVAARYGTEHVELLVEPAIAAEIPAIVRHFDEPFSDPSMIPSFAVARLAARDVKVVLNGDGADEIFAGYRHFVAARAAHRLDGLGAAALRPLLAGIAAALPLPGRGRTPYQYVHRFLRVLGANEAERFLVLTGDRLSRAEKAWLYGDRAADGGVRDSAAEFLDIAGAAALGAVDLTSQRDFRLLLGAEHLVKMDMASMAATLEARSPFLDHELIEFAALLPEHFKLAGRTTKPLLRQLAARMLPKSVSTAPKRGFEVPLQRWMEHDLNGLLHETVLDSASYAMTHFQRDRVRALIERPAMDAKRWAGIAWMLLCLEFWWQGLCTRRRTAAPAPSRPDVVAVA